MRESIALVNQGCRRIAFLGPPLSRDPFRRGLASKGQEPVFEGLFPFGDPAPAISALAARNVDCVYLDALESTIRTFVDTADRAGVQLRDGDVYADSVMKALRSFKGNTALFGPVDFTRELANPDYRRMSVANAFSYRIFNGKPIRIGEPVDISAVIEKAS